MGAHGGSQRGSSRATAGTVLAGTLGIVGEILFGLFLLVVAVPWLVLQVALEGIEWLWNRYVRGDKRSAWQRTMDNVRRQSAWERLYVCRDCGDEWKFHVSDGTRWQCSECEEAIASSYEDPPDAPCRLPRPEGWAPEPLEH